MQTEENKLVINHNQVKTPSYILGKSCMPIVHVPMSPLIAPDLYGSFG